MTFILLPLLPNRPVDPLGVLNPYEIWLLTILIAVVSFLGYAAVKLAGPQKGIALAAAAGGLINSTAVSLTLARMALENPARVRLLERVHQGANHLRVEEAHAPQVDHHVRLARAQDVRDPESDLRRVRDVELAVEGHDPDPRGSRLCCEGRPG